MKDEQKSSLLLGYILHISAKLSKLNVLILQLNENAAFAETLCMKHLNTLALQFACLACLYLVFVYNTDEHNCSKLK